MRWGNFEGENDGSEKKIGDLSCRGAPGEQRRSPTFFLNSIVFTSKIAPTRCKRAGRPRYALQPAGRPRYALQPGWRTLGGPRYALHQLCDVTQSGADHRTGKANAVLSPYALRQTFQHRLPKHNHNRHTTSSHHHPQTTFRSFNHNILTTTTTST